MDQYVIILLVVVCSSCLIASSFGSYMFKDKISGSIKDYEIQKDYNLPENYKVPTI